MRGNLIFSRYKGVLYRAILDPSGTAVLAMSKDPLPLGIGNQGLSVTQAPGGSLVEVSLESNALYYYTAKEAATKAMVVDTVFPKRGGLGGGSSLFVYGNNFNKSGVLSVQVSGKNCLTTNVSATIIECTLPPGGLGTADIVVQLGAETSTFLDGYRYIAGS